jgi:hypothetical protein
MQNKCELSYLLNSMQYLLSTAHQPKHAQLLPWAPGGNGCIGSGISAMALSTRFRLRTDFTRGAETYNFPANSGSLDVS